MFNIFKKKEKVLENAGWSFDPKQLQLCHTDKFGNKFYEFTCLEVIPYLRYIAGETAARYAEFNLTGEAFGKLLDKTLAHANKGELTQVISILVEIDNRRRFCGTEATLYELACCYYILEGEDVNEPSQYWNDKKKELWSKDGRARAFFLQSAFTFTAQFNDMRTTDIPTYLSKNSIALRKSNLTLGLQ